VVKAADIDIRADKRMKQQKVEKKILTHMDIIYDKRDTTEHGKRTAFSNIVLGSGWISFASFAATPRPWAGKYIHEKNINITSHLGNAHLK